ncbi:hypothetical protein [Caballeronia telluris]|jgi:hypothetical protein|uniref:Uncharacterized protein n=1 Tax=Caballeronia telluris TaxID=326475 RepID=A0A158K990_9BURK|nr:hypothetical protein [Caballeronia telluris]SAL77686.1 hypothetical protein AWB66_05682 [Caballeronia telluris]
MDTNTHASFATWLDAADTVGDEQAPVSHHSSQVCAEPEYVAEVCGRFAGERAEDGEPSRVVRGYN